jgi:hypothetical protein
MLKWFLTSIADAAFLFWDPRRVRQALDARNTDLRQRRISRFWQWVTQRILPSQREFAFAAVTADLAAAK